MSKVYDISKFSIESTRHGYTVYYDGEFWESADTYAEAEKDINNAVLQSEMAQFASGVA